MTAAAESCCSAFIRSRRLAPTSSMRAATKTGGSLIHGLAKTIDWKIVGRLGAGSVAGYHHLPSRSLSPLSTLSGGARSFCHHHDARRGALYHPPRWC